MARGSKPGERRGGRKAGSKNKRTLEAERIANEAALKRSAEALENPEKPLAKDVLESIMFACMSIADDHKPSKVGMPAREGQSNDMFFRALDLAVTSGKAAASFQSPTFKQVDYRPVLPMLPEQKRNGDDAKVIDIKDAKVQSQIYMRLIKSSSTK